MKIKNSAKVLTLGAALMGLSAIVNAQEVSKPRIDTLHHKEVRILEQYVTFTPTYKELNFNDDKDPRHTDRPTFKVFSDTKKVIDYFASKYLTGLSKQSLKVMKESIDTKMSTSELLGKDRLQPLPVEIGNYLTSILNNEGPEMHKKDTIMDRIGHITKAEYTSLYKLLNRSDYNEYWAVIAKHNDPTQTIEKDLKTGKIDTLYNAAQNIAIPIRIRLIDTNAKCTTSGTSGSKEKNYSKQKITSDKQESYITRSDSTETQMSDSTNSNSGNDSGEILRIPGDNKTAISIELAPGYNFSSKIPVGQLLVGLRIGNLEAVLLGGGGISNHDNAMDFPSTDGKSGTSIKDHSNSTNYNFGGMLGYYPGGFGLEILAGAERDNTTVTKQQIIRQWVTDALGNNRDVTFKGEPSNITAGHYNAKVGLGYAFKNGWRVNIFESSNITNIKKTWKQPEAVYLGFGRKF